MIRSTLFSLVVIPFVLGTDHSGAAATRAAESPPPFPFVSTELLHRPFKVSFLPSAYYDGPTTITSAGTYVFSSCSSGGTGWTGFPKVAWTSSSSFAAGSTSGTNSYSGDTCAGTLKNIYYGTTSFDVTPYYCFGSCTPYGSQHVTVSIPQPFAVSISGSTHGHNPLSDTWYASIDLVGPSVAPYTYEWSGALSGTGDSSSSTFSDESTYWIYLTVTDANGLKAYSSMPVYVCSDVC